MQAIHTKYKNRSNNTPTGIFSKISRLRSMFLFFSVILASMIIAAASMIFKVRSMIFRQASTASLPRHTFANFAILAFLATMSVFGFSASVFADSSSSAVYGDEGSVENSSNFSVTVEELNALELRLSASDLVLDLNPTSDAPVFGSSDLSVTVYTTNTTGYYLTMTPTTTNLTRTEALNGNYPTIATLASAVAPSTFSSTSDTTTANKWGYKVNTTNLSTIDTTNYNPAVTTAVPLNKTTAPLANGDETDITFAAKVDADTVAGSYKTTLSFTAVTNANTYSITFNPGSASSDSSLTNMPSPNPQTGALESGSSTSITLSSSTPTRAGYSFLGWCSVAPTTSNNTDSCSGTTYQPGGSITIYTDTPDTTLYAMWGIDSYAITLNGDSGVSNFTVNSSTVSKGGSVSLTYGQTYTITINYVNGYEAAATPLQKSSGQGTVSGTNFTVGAGTATLYANSKASAVTVTFKSNTASGINLCTSRTSCTTYANNATAPLALGSYTIYGAYGSRQGFSSWSTTSGGSVDSPSAPATTFTISSATTLTLNGTTTSTAIQNLSSSSCTSTASLVYDNRDEQTYQIQRLADGNCWMMTNLNLGATTLSTDLTSSNTNLSGTITTSTFNDWKKSSGTGTYTSAEFVSQNGADTTAAAPYGTLYNYCAASAGTICTSSNSNNASSDLCPAGWRLPTGGSSGEFQTLYSQSAYNSNENMRKSVANGGAAFALAGYFTNSMPKNQGIYGYYWSSTRYYNSDMYDLILTTVGVNASDCYNRNSGFSIRCILNEPTIADVTYLQDVTPEIGKNTAIGTTATLKDNRDNQNYVVKKLDDGRVWMITNLNLGATTLTTDLTSANTNLSTTVTADTFNGWKKSSGSGTRTSAEFIPKSGTDSTSGTAYGTLYNYCAASAGTICTRSNSSNASYDLCPAGWRLPTSGSGGEFATLYANASYNTSAKMRASIANGGAAFALAGYFNNSTPTDQGSNGYYWSSTRNNNTGMYYLRLDTSAVYPSDYGSRSSGFSIRCILKATA